MISTYKVFLMVRETEVKKFKYIDTYMYNHTYMYDFNDLTILQPKYFT